MSPQVYICSQCSYVLWGSEGKQLDKPLKGTRTYTSYDIKTPQEIIELHNGKCPKCNHPLKFSSTKPKITIKIADA